MTRDTSIEVYRQIESEGLLAAVDWVAYQNLFHHGPLTQGECWNEHCSHLYMRHTVGPAFARLKRRGVIREVGKRTCRLTGKTVYSWDVTSHLPKKNEYIELLEKIQYKKARRYKLDEEIEKLEARLDEIKAEEQKQKTIGAALSALVR